MTHYTSTSARQFDGDYITATLLNQAHDMRKAAQECFTDAEAARLIERAQELETAASLLELAGQKIADAYQAIGHLADAAGVFEDRGVASSLDYMLDCLDVMDAEYRFVIEKPSIRMRVDDWFSRRWRKVRHLVGHYYEWERR